MVADDKTKATWRNADRGGSYHHDHPETCPGKAENREKRLGAVFHEMGVITEGKLRDFLAKQFDLKVIKDIATRQIARETLDLIPVDLAIQKLLFPMMTHNGTLALAETDPLDCDTIDYVALKAAIRVMPILAA
jgi:hypothetical protein